MAVLVLQSDERNDQFVRIMREMTAVKVEHERALHQAAMDGANCLFSLDVQLRAV